MIGTGRAAQVDGYTRKVIRNVIDTRSSPQNDRLKCRLIGPR